MAEVVVFGFCGEEGDSACDQCAAEDEVCFCVVVFCCVFADGAVYGADGEIACTDGYHAVAPSPTRPVAFDVSDLVNVEGLAIDINGIAMQIVDGAGEPLVVNSAECQGITDRICADMHAPFLQYDNVPLSVAQERNDAKKQYDESMHMLVQTYDFAL